jgi:hypothetical protein
MGQTPLIIAIKFYHRSDSLGIGVEIGGGIVGFASLSDAVDLLVDLCAVVVALLAGTGNGELDSTGMPCSDTGNLTQTLVCLTGKLLRVPTRGNT